MHMIPVHIDMQQKYTQNDTHLLQKRTELNWSTHLYVVFYPVRLSV